MSTDGTIHIFLGSILEASAISPSVNGDAAREADRTGLPGVRNIPVLLGLTPPGHFEDQAEDVLAEAREILVASGKVFRFANMLSMEVGTGPTAHLATLCCDFDVESRATSILPNLFICELKSVGSRPTVQFGPPPRFVAQLLNSFLTREALPQVETYARRPIFDQTFRLRGPGYHAESKILVHGLAVSPMELREVNSQLPIRDRLPPHLRTALQDFCFRSDADVANAVGALLTGVLANHFVDVGKAVPLLDGNQPQVGKSLFAKLLGIVFDGDTPHFIKFTQDEEELEKKIGAQIRKRSQQSVVWIDNAKVTGGGPINSATIEANSLATTVSIRILGKSASVCRRNDLLWVITMNDTKASPDLTQRGLPIQFYYEGKPEDRRFHGRDPLRYAQIHRVELLAELYGMVNRWVQFGRPEGNQSHTLTYWVQTIGGILAANGIPEFLANRDEAAGEFNVTLEEVAALAEAVSRRGGPAWWVVQPALGECAAATADEPVGLRAGEWSQLFVDAKLAAGTAKTGAARSTQIGKFLSRHLGREVEIEPNGQVGRAVLRSIDGSGRQRRYYFEVRWLSGDSGNEPCTGTAGSGAAAIGDVPVIGTPGAGVDRPVPEASTEAPEPSPDVEGGAANSEVW